MRMFLAYLAGWIGFMAVCVAWIFFGEPLLVAAGAPAWIVWLSEYVAAMLPITFSGWFARGMMRARARKLRQSAA